MLKNRNRTVEPSPAFPVGRMIVTSLTGLFLTGLLTMLAAVLLHREILPISVCGWMGPLIIAFSALCSTWLSAHNNQKKLLCGLISVGIYGLALVICGMLLFSTPMRPERMLLSTGALLTGMLGGVVLSAFLE